MTKFLTELITEDTPILLLEPNSNISKKEKNKVLGLECSLSDTYTAYMYYYNNKWYYFKRDYTNGGYPFYIIDELMGTYLSKKRNLPTVLYEIAQVDESYGLASINFKQSGFKYYTLSQLMDDELFYSVIENIDILKSFTVNYANEREFLNHLFNLFSLDIHMLQRDRGNVNLQFQINGENNYFDIAPLYDYSNCSQVVGIDGLNIRNVIMDLNEISIRSLLRKYPDFQKSLALCLEQNMKEIWEQICLDYHLNQECSAYERIKDYYEFKDEKQKQYIKQILKDVK